MKTILLVFGTRPEAIKMAPLVKALEKQNELFKTVVCVTGQHREMLDQVLQLFDIKPHYDLNIMKPGQDLYDVTARVLVGMRNVLDEVKPDMVLIHGDTTTSTAAALSAFYKQIPVVHVEAGLRTHDIYSPWPEEMNRQLTGRLATLHFAPTTLSKNNLLNEGINEEKIAVTGNTVIDALHQVIEAINGNTQLEGTILNGLAGLGLLPDAISQWGATRKMVLITGHRRENFGEGFLNICHAIKELSTKYPEVDFVYPVHLNPNVQKPVNDILGEKTGSSSNVFLVKPLDYLPFVYLMSKSYLVLTDSGGIQEEAPGLGKPVLVMRDTTERPEAVDAGTVLLVGTNRENIVKEVIRLLDDNVHYNNMSQSVNPYGDGKACDRIVEALKDCKI